MLLWHLGATTALTRYAFRDEKMDLRFLLLGAVLPDLIDTPVGLLFFDSLQSVRLIAHSLPLAALLMTSIVLSTRRGRPRKRWMPVAIGVLVHLFLDAMWADPETLWWPLLGLDFSKANAATLSDLVAETLGNWWVWAGELAGLAYLILLAKRSGLQTTEARRHFIETGRVSAPIGFSDR